jgi:hypothetical protein
MLVPRDASAASRPQDVVLLRCRLIDGYGPKNLALLRIGNGIQVQDQLGDQVVFGVEVRRGQFQYFRESLNGSVVRLMFPVLVLVDS